MLVSVFPWAAGAGAACGQTGGRRSGWRTAPGSEVQTGSEVLAAFLVQMALVTPEECVVWVGCVADKMEWEQGTLEGSCFWV